ncbi:MAG: Holliday junction branch migration protein RuvA, partial [Clostridia bacterium]|nr:Holliday junction branch migration protein RuvA [Clostridia bacterium]
TMMNVREDAIELFGFADKRELDCFKQLTSITGVGPKAGIAVLSELSPEKVALAVAAGDHKAFTRAPGVGPKLAQRIVLEMKDKVAALAPSDGVDIGSGTVSISVGNAAEAVRALSVLGFSQSEAAAAVGKLDETLGVEELVRGALKSLAKG